MGLFHVASNGYVWKALFLQRHPERSRGIFLAGGDNVVCAIAEKGEPFAKRSKKKWSARNISCCARNDGMGGMGLFHVASNGYVWKALFPYRHPERSRGIFLAHRYSVLCATAGKGNPYVKGARKSRVQGRFLAAPLMTAWGQNLFHEFEISNK